MDIFLAVFSAFRAHIHTRTRAHTHTHIYKHYTHLLGSSREKLDEKQLGKETNWLLASYEVPQLFSSLTVLGVLSRRQPNCSCLSWC